MDGENQRDLRERFRAGELAALREVYVTYVDDIYALGRYGFVLPGSPPRRVPALLEPQAQRDFVQDVFVRALGERARLQYDGLRPYRPFLLQIAKNLRIDQLRKSGRELLTLDAGSGPDIDSLIEGDLALPAPIEEELRHDRLQQATRAFLATQDEETRRFVALRFSEELSQADVAVRTGATRRRIRTLEARVQADLARYLRKLGLRD